MNGYKAFLKKEFLESTRTSRLWVMLVIFFILGVISPLLAKLMPELVANFMPDGMAITVPEPTALDSWTQFFKNVGQLGLIVMVILFSSLLSGEFTRGTLINMLSKGLCRNTVILSKFTAASLIWTMSYFLAFGVTASYTLYYWSVDFSKELWLSIVGLWLFGILLLSLVILGSILFRNSYGGILFTGIITALLFLLNLFPKLQEYNPLLTASMGASLLAGKAELTQIYWSMAICALSIVMLIVLSLILFRKKQVLHASV